jgi:hypothetical protein
MQVADAAVPVSVTRGSGYCLALQGQRDDKETD